MKYTLNCPTCGKERSYSSKASMLDAKRNNRECRSCATLKYAKRESSLDNLKNRNLIFYYWLGFLLADGHFSNSRLTLTLAKKDKNHVKKLSKYLDIKYRETGRGLPTTSVMNKKIIGNLINEFNISSNKTRNPPKPKYYSKLKEEELKSILIGFIDGDGNIKQQTNRKTHLIRIKCDKSWIEYFKFLYHKLELGGKPYINNQGYLKWNIGSNTQCLQLNKFANNNNLPILKRKWGKLNVKK